MISTEEYKSLLETSLLGENINHEYTSNAKKMIMNKVILVTGAGGSVGSEIVNQLNIIGGAKKIVCLDRDEYALYKLELKLTGTALLSSEELVLGDITSYRSLTNVMNQFKPNIVFHAAAVKHLPLLERSPDVAVMTNIKGTENVVKCAVESGVERVVNISTDKAASPTSVLGYTKRIAEKIAKSYCDNGTLISSVRFGNVFASRGSFIETLQWQVNNKKPITITDSEMTRYFMSIPQAAGLVIEAGVLADSGHTYVLDMGVPFKIIDVLNKYAELTKSESLEITFSGIRPGEKVDEILFDQSETSLETENPKISEVTVGLIDDEFRKDVNKLYTRVEKSSVSDNEIKEIVRQLANGKDEV